MRKTKTIKNQLLLYFQLCFKSCAVILSELLFNFCNSDTKNITRYSARRTHFEATEVFATHPHTMSIANRKISDLLVFSFAISVLALQRNTIKSVIILYWRSVYVSLIKTFRLSRRHIEIARMSVRTISNVHCWLCVIQKSPHVLGDTLENESWLRHNRKNTWNIVEEKERYRKEP